MKTGDVNSIIFILCTYFVLCQFKYYIIVISLMQYLYYQLRRTSDEFYGCSHGRPDFDLPNIWFTNC